MTSTEEFLLQENVPVGQFLDHCLLGSIPPNEHQPYSAQGNILTMLWLLTPSWGLLGHPSASSTRPAIPLLSWKSCWLWATSWCGSKNLPSSLFPLCSLSRYPITSLRSTWDQDCRLDTKASSKCKLEFWAKFVQKHLTFSMRLFSFLTSTRDEVCKALSNNASLSIPMCQSLCLNNVDIDCWLFIERWMLEVP